MALANQPVKALQVVAGKAEMVEVDGFDRLRAVEQAQHDALAERGRYRRDAQVDVAAGDAQADSAVLRQALLGDIEARHHLDPRGDRRLKALGRRQYVVHHPVHAEAHHHFLFENFNMDVAGAVLDRLRQDAVDELDDRRRIVGTRQVQRLRRQFAGDHVEPLFLEVDHQVLGRGGRRLVVRAVDCFGDYFGRRDQRMNLRAVQDSQVIERFVVGGVGDRHRYRAVGVRQRQQAVFLGVVDRDLRDQNRVERMLIYMGLVWQPVFLRERARQPLRLQRAHLDQHVGQVLAGLLALARFVEVLRRDPRAVQQDCLEAFSCGRHQAIPRKSSETAGARPQGFTSYGVIFNDNAATPNLPPFPLYPLN